MKPSTLYLVLFPFFLFLSKPHTPAKAKYTDYYFHYVGTTGYEPNPALWQFIGHDLGSCTCTYDSEASCIIKVDPDIVSPKSPASYEISQYLLYLKYGTLKLPMLVGISPFRVPDPFAHLGLYQEVINTSVGMNATNTKAQ